jgi:hypothetical protein
VTYPPGLVDRLDELSDLLNEGRNDIIKRALAIGVAAIEAEVTAHTAYKNALGVAAKLKRRGQSWEQAIELLESSESDQSEVIQLLRRSAGGE